MIPLKDENPQRSFPVVTILLITINVAVFIYQLLMRQAESQTFVYQFGAVPNVIVHGQNLYAPFTSMFLHGGLLHIAGNMLYLWIFGDNVEYLCGHFRFLLFYLLCGFIAFLSHFLTVPFSNIPMIGASGAISGVLGAYALKFPRARVYVLVPLFIWIWRIFRIPAAVVLGFWFLIQIISGLSSPGSGAGVAWFAHIGGFVSGMILIRFFTKKRYKISFD
ncbi:MAG: rhomboid family intramembrane serine protease [Actinobacteria bacterium]|nr:rhomboid family intramembrane serine protease [Actinomycetota bacterium]